MEVKDFTYSLLIPTRNRQETAIYAIESGLNCEYPGLQIVVSDNSDDETLKTMLEEKGWLDKVTYHKTDRVLSMRDNWEQALDLATGEILSVIGDDDAIMPDALLRANLFFSRYEDADVLHSKAAIYKWPNYICPSRRNFLTFGHDERILYHAEPKEMLRKAYDYSYKCGTGPGLYYGFVKRSFLEAVKQTRGRWIVDLIPDQDSGYVTLMYAKAYGECLRPLFVSGHSGKSNSGAMRVQSTNSKHLDTFAKEAASEHDVLWLDRVKSIRAVIVSCQLRLLKEAKRVLNDPTLDLNRAEAVNYIADGFKEGYEAVSFFSSLNKLKELAKQWGVENRVKYPEGRAVIRGVLVEGGAVEIFCPKEEDSTSQKPSEPTIMRQSVNGQAAGFKNILDAIRYVNAALPHLATNTGPVTSKYIWKKLEPKMNQLLVAGKSAIQNNNYQLAIESLEALLAINPLHGEANQLLAEAYISQDDWLKASPYLANRLSSSPTLEAVQLYVKALLKLNQAKDALEFVNVILQQEQRVEYWHCLFDVYYQLENYQAALETAKKIESDIKIKNNSEFNEKLAYLERIYKGD